MRVGVRLAVRRRLGAAQRNREHRPAVLPSPPQERGPDQERRTPVTHLEVRVPPPERMAILAGDRIDIDTKRLTQCERIPAVVPRDGNQVARAIAIEIRVRR